MPQVNFTGNTRGKPAWMKDWADRDGLAKFPAKLDPTSFSDELAKTIKLSAAASGGVDEVVTLTIDATSGTYKLTFGGQETVAIAEAATAAVVQAALEGLSTIGTGNVSVVGADGGPYTIMFRGALGRTNVGAITVTSSTLAGGGATGTPVVTKAGADAATSLSVDALPVRLESGTLLPFANGVTVRVAAEAALGATSITVDKISGPIPDDTEAPYSQYGRKLIPSGTYLGRTYAERDAGTPFGPCDDSDDERYLLAFDIWDANANAGYVDCELYAHGKTVAENFLPDWSTIEADAALLAKLRADYECIKGEN